MPEEKPASPELNFEPHRAYLRILAQLQLSPALRGKLDPSDIVQLTLLKAVKSIGQFRGTTAGELAVWLRQILARTLANAARDHGRGRRDIALERSLDRSVEESSARLGAWLAAEQSSASHRAERNELSLLLVQSLARLPEAQRGALAQALPGLVAGRDCATPRPQSSRRRFAASARAPPAPRAPGRRSELA